jgi:hypothetical protein
LATHGEKNGWPQAVTDLGGTGGGHGPPIPKNNNKFRLYFFFFFFKLWSPLFFLCFDPPFFTLDPSLAAWLPVLVKDRKRWVVARLLVLVKDSRMTITHSFLKLFPTFKK